MIVICFIHTESLLLIHTLCRKSTSEIHRSIKLMTFQEMPYMDVIICKWRRFDWWNTKTNT